MSTPSSSTPSCPPSCDVREEQLNLELCSPSLLSDATSPPSPLVLPVELLSPASPLALCLFLHSSSSLSQSAPSHSSAASLASLGVACALVPLLSPVECSITHLHPHLRSDLSLLSLRVSAVHSRLLALRPSLAPVPLGLVAVGYAAGPALLAAASLGATAVATRSGMGHLAGREVLAAVRAPVLAVVGSADVGVWQDNREAMKGMEGARLRRLAVVWGAGHLFQEEGATEKVVRMTARWMQRWLLEGGKEREGGAEEWDVKEEVGKEAEVCEAKQ